MSNGMMNPLAMEVPVDKDNEGHILANAIKDHEHQKTFARKCDVTQFRHPQFKAIAWAIKDIVDKNLQVDPDMILLKSKSSPYRTDIDFAFVDDLMSSFPIVSKENFETHMVQLSVDSIKHSLAKSAMEGLYQACLNPKSDLGYLQERIAYLNTIVEKGFQASVSGFEHMDTIIPRYLAQKDSNTAFRTTGFRQLDDKLTEGYGGGKITIVAALPGMGKTSFVLSSMKNLSNRKIWSAQFALETDTMSLTSKLIAYNSGISISRITKHYHQLSDAEKKIFDFEVERLKNNKYIMFNETPRVKLRDIREQIMILQDRIKEQYIVVPIDLFGKIGDFAAADNFSSAYEKKLNETQVMARDLGVHLILVAQINRGAVNRNTKFSRPKMSDLKNSGAFEEIADLLLAVHRPYYDPEKALKSKIAYGDDSKTVADDMIDDDPNKNIAEVIILKQRMGAGNDLVNFYFDPDTTKFGPIDPEQQMLMNASKTDLWNE